MRPITSSTHQVGVIIHDQVGDLMNPPLSVPPATAQDGFDSGHQLVEAERLVEIVVGTELQAPDPIIDVALGGKDLINNSDDATFTAELDQWLDVHGFATYLAMHDIVDNFDDIDGPGNNSHLYYDTETGRFTVVPWDYNLAFGAMPGGGLAGDRPAPAADESLGPAGDPPRAWCRPPTQPMESIPAPERPCRKGSVGLPVDRVEGTARVRMRSGV